MSSTESLTTTNLLACATELLSSGGYRRAQAISAQQWPAANAGVFEDSFGIVAVIIYDTWRDLESTWSDAQAAFVELISRQFSSSDAKAWDGYLVLLTPAAGPYSGVTNIRYDTSRVRKLVATGDELKTLADVERALLPLLPLDTEVPLGEEESVLEMLPQILSNRNVPEGAVRAVLQGFEEQQPLMDRLFSYLGGNEDQGS